MKILVDTNVIIDILCKREPFFEDSYNSLNKCWYYVKKKDS